MITLTRLPDWRTRLSAFSSEIKRRPLGYGVFDCGIGLAAGGIEAVTGVDLAEPYRGRYDTEAGALQMLRDEGYEDLEAFGRHLLPACHPSAGRIADIAYIDTGAAIGGLGIVLGERVLVLTGKGSGTVDLLAAKLVFRVG